MTDADDIPEADESFFQRAKLIVPTPRKIEPPRYDALADPILYPDSNEPPLKWWHILIVHPVMCFIIIAGFALVIYAASPRQ